MRALPELESELPAPRRRRACCRGPHRIWQLRALVTAAGHVWRTGTNVLVQLRRG